MSRLRHEIVQRRPFASPAEEAFLNLQRTANALMQALGGFLKAHDVTPTQYNALRILRGAGEDGLPCREVGRRLVTRVPDVTRLLDRLEGRALISRHRDADDRRVVRSRISAAGLELLARVDRPLSDWIDETMRPLARAETRSLIDMLERLRHPRTPAPRNETPTTLLETT